MTQPSAIPQRHQPSASYDALIIVPPFFELSYPSLGAHVLQACAEAAGHRVKVLYANLLFAAYVGVPRYKSLGQSPLGTFACERLFARAAYGVAPLGRQDLMLAPERIHGTEHAAGIFDEDPHYGEAYRWWLVRGEALVPFWVAAIGRYIAGLGIPVIGATTTFQHTPAIALLRAVHHALPRVTTIIGGANCEGEMAEGVRHLAPFIDCVFSGESEETFPRFLSAIACGQRPTDPIVHGRPCENLDALPTPTYEDYVEQRAGFLTPQTAALVGPLSIVYETSRGCWWGQKSHCTFCGLNGEGMASRAKSPDRVMEEVCVLVERYAPASITMADNIMPYGYFTTVLPRLASELPGLHIFYEQKANITRDRLVLMKEAGIDAIQPGIESLSTELLRLMRKGTTAAQNINLLRDSRGLHLDLHWNLLWGFPGESVRAYEEMLGIIPLMHHLQPAGGFVPLVFQRFSPYFDRREEFGITQMRPYPGYADFLPPGAPIEKIAYHFTGNYPCAAREAPEFIRKLAVAVRQWQDAWSRLDKPQLQLLVHGGRYWLHDTRGLPDSEAIRAISLADARRLVTPERYEDRSDQRELIQRRVALHIDGLLVPLVVSEQSVFVRLQQAAALGQRPARPAARHLTLADHATA